MPSKDCCIVCQAKNPSFQLPADTSDKFEWMNILGLAMAFIQVFGDKYKDQSEIIVIIDSYVDVMNSSFKYDRIKANKCGLGKYQDIFLIENINYSINLKFKTTNI